MELTTRDEGQIQIASEGLKDPFDAVIALYHAATARQVKRKFRQKRDFFTVDEQKALAYYRDAVMSIKAIA